MKNEILSLLPQQHPWENHIHCFDSVDSTNDLAKELAAQGAPEGTVVIAARQSAGRGRMGRSFYAPSGLGLYLSVILRPQCPAHQLLHLTCAAAVAACDGIDRCCGLQPGIKWINDLVMGNKKLGGILTEMSIHPATGMVEWAVIGIGINCCHRRKDFPPLLRDTATSLLLETKKSFSPACLAAYLIPALHKIYTELFTGKQCILDRYRRSCLNINRPVVIHRADTTIQGTALSIDDEGSLIVQTRDGQCLTVQSGEVSVRGLYGYV